MSDTFEFGRALHCLRQGKRVRRKGWEMEELWLEMETSILLRYPNGLRILWMAPQNDLLAWDWIVEN